ncbi:hypothetical protein [Neobacillus sp. FSL H8-0543]
MITAIRMYRFCHLFYQGLPWDLPLVAIVLTNGVISGNCIYNVKVLKT